MKISEKMEKIQRRIKKKFKSEKWTSQNKCSSVMRSSREWRGNKKESVNLKTEE